jgi:hypothetical protein
MSVDEFVAAEDFPGHDVLKKVLEVRSDDFTWLPDGRIWFSRAPLPVRRGFERMADALEFAFSVYVEGATIEELQRLLCLAHCDEMPITRRAIAKELGQRADRFPQIRRGVYAMRGMQGIAGQPQAENSRVAKLWMCGWEVEEDEEKPFNAESFFGGGFCFAAE